MNDWGIRISRSGKDVKTCTDLETVMTSKYAFFKGSLIFSGSVILTNQQTSNITITHNYGYIPFYQARCSTYFNEAQYINLPGGQEVHQFGPLGFTGDCYADSTNIYLTIQQNNYTDPPFPPILAGTNTYNYVVFIYKDRS